VISRRPRSDLAAARQPFWRVRLDLFTYKPGLNNARYALILNDEYTGLNFVWTFETKSESMAVIVDMETRISRVLGLFVAYISLDQESSLVAPIDSQRKFPLDIYAADEGIEIEKAPTGVKEHLGHKMNI
jgi:hypothetical protein